MPEHRDGKQPPLVVATTLPFFERAATIVDETRRELERMAAVLDQCAEHLSADSSERAILELMASGIHELKRRLEHVEAALCAYLPAP
jgi:hypothetical protein